MNAYSPPLEGRRNFIRLDFNENSRGCSPAILEALKHVTLQDIATYPEYGTLYEHLAGFLGIPREYMVVTNASDEGIQLIFQTFLEAGSRLVLPVPTFAMFTFYAELLDLRIERVPYLPDLSFPEETVLQALTLDTKALVLVNPNNPTGTPIRHDYIIDILERMKDRLVLVDEAYVEFNGESALDLLDRYDNLVILRTFSKAFGMAGLRLGVVFSCPENIRHLSKAHSPYSISALTVKLALAALEDTDSVTGYIADVRKSKARLGEALAAMNIPTYPSAANFLLARFGEACTRVENELRKRGILVRNFSHAPLLDGCLRITAGTPEQTDKLIAALKELKE
ncbi:MAG: histidinol-phosphate transaminase [Elusimicrobia bacterium RIFOXYB2_FULL_49_7]|nr:MAG: histidinol-phosphate transaminase [Elusimicrobia bacterium RIFOXYB2_FULL_49_7]